MKKIIILLLISNFVSAQFKVNDETSTNISVLVDPSASLKEKGLNIGAEINYREDGLYLHTGIQSFAVLPGNYLDWTTGIGIKFKYNDFNPYIGGRLGFIKRGKENPYSTYGAEAGIDYTLGKFLVGLRSTYDLRNDFKYYGANSDWRFSTFVKIGVKIN